MNLEILPNEILVIICSYLQIPDIINISETNKFFNSVYKEHSNYITKLNSNNRTKNIRFYYYISKKDKHEMVAESIINNEIEIFKDIEEDYLTHNKKYNECEILKKLIEILKNKLKAGKYINFEKIENQTNKIGIKIKDYGIFLKDTLEGGNEKTIISIIKKVKFMDSIKLAIKYGKKHPEILKDILENNKYKDADIMVRYTIGNYTMQQLYLNDLYEENWKYLGERFELFEHKSIEHIFNVINKGDTNEWDNILYDSDIKQHVIINMNYIKLAAKNYNKNPIMLKYILSDKWFIKMFNKKEIIKILNQYKIETTVFYS